MKLTIIPTGKDSGELVDKPSIFAPEAGYTDTALVPAFMTETVRPPVAVGRVVPDGDAAVVVMTFRSAVRGAAPCPLLPAETEAARDTIAAVRVGAVERTTDPVPVDVVTPVPPFATCRVPPSTIDPEVAEAGVSPVVPPENEATALVHVGVAPVPAEVRT